MTLIETLLSQDAVQRLGWTLVHFVWQGAAVAVLLALGLQLARRRAAGVRYAAGCVAMLVMVALPVVTFVLVPGHQETVAPSADNENLTALDTSESDLQTQTVPSPGATVLPSAASASLDPLSETLTTGDEAPVLQVPDSVIVPSEHEAASPWQQGLLGRLELLLPWLVAIWLVGVGLLSLRLLGGWIHLQRFKRRAVQPVNFRLHQTVSHIAEQLRVSRPVRLLESALVQVPTVIGWLRPVILVPAHVLRDLAPQQLQALLAHELAHIRRYDYLVNLFQTVVETLLFYHPAVWWVSHRIRVERENCCDDLAVSVFGDRVTYARALAELEGLRGQSPQLAVAADGRVLLPRIRRVLRLPGEERGKAPSWMAGLVVLVAFVAVTAALFVRAEQRDPGQTTEQEPSVQSPLQELWQKLDDLDEERRALARRRWDALSVVEQAVIVRRGWTQRGPTEQEMQAVMNEEGARKFLADARRQLGKRWEAHLVGETLGTLTRDERVAFENRRNVLVAEIAELGEAVVGELIVEIERRGAHERDACEALEQLGNAAVPALLDAVASTREDWPRTKLLEVLAEVEDARAQQTLERALGDSFPHARLAALRGLSKLDTATQEMYLRCLEDDYDWLRHMAIGGLAKVGDEKAIPALLAVVRHDLRRDKGGGYWLRREAAEAVVRICERTGKSVELPPEETWQKGKPATFESLNRAATCDNAAIRRDAIFRLGSLREKRTLEFLLVRLRSDPVPQNRAAAVSALYDLLARTGDDTKRLQLSHAERELVFNAVLDTVLREDPLVSRRALGYIGGIAGEYLTEYERFPELFTRALRYIYGEDRSLQLAGVQVISRLGRWHTEALEKHLSPERRVRLIAELKAGMEDSEVGYRIRFIEVLGHLRERSIVPRLIELLGHEDATVRAFVVTALGGIGDRRAVPALEKVAESDPATNNKGEFYLREYAQNAIEQIRAEDSQSGQTSAVREVWEELDALEAKRRETESRRWNALSVVEQAQRVHNLPGGQPPPQGSPKRKPPKFSEEEARKFLAETRQRHGNRWTETLDHARSGLLSKEEQRDFADQYRKLIARAAALGEPAIGPLIDEIVRKGPHSPEADGALRLLGRPAVPALLDALPNAKDEWIRARLLDLLAWAKDPRARPALQRALDDPSWSTRRTALHGLERLGAVPQDVYLRFLEEERDLPRQDAIAGLAKVGDEKAIPALLYVARNDMAQGKLGLGGYYLRRQAIEALKQISERTGQSVGLPSEQDTPSVTPEIGEAADPKDLEESAAPEFPFPSPSVPEVEGVQCRLRADKAVFEVGEPLTFKVDVRNRGTRQLNAYRTVDRQELELDFVFEVDGKRYMPSPRGFDELPFGPGAEYANISACLDDSYRDIRAGKSYPLDLKPGKHRIRAVFMGHPTNSAMAPVRTLSNPVEIEVVSPQSPAEVGASREPEQKEPLSFGPVIERVLVGDKTTNTIDLDCGELFPWPLPVVLMDSYPRDRWFAENGIDAMLGFSLPPSPYDDPERLLPREAYGETASGEKRAELWAFNSTIVPLTNESWDRLGPEVVFPTMASGPSRTAISIAEPLPRTYLFATREGGKGVLQIVQLVTDEPQRVRIRYKMFERSSEELVAERGDGRQLSFGPVIERVVYDDEVGKNNLIDLDTGNSFVIQKFFARYDTPMTEEQKQEFCKQNGVDMAGEVRHVRSGLWLVHSAAVPIVDERWNRITPEQVVAGLRSAKPGTPEAIRTMCTLPRTCLFNTREGGMGVLQIMKPAIDEPEGLEIRYKLVRSVTADKP